MRILWILLIGVSFLSATLTRNNNVVNDSETSLQWQDNENQATLTRISWKNAISYCEGISLNGFTNWRLPNIRELKSIVDRTEINPSVNTFAYTETVIAYWSASSLEGSSTRAWDITFSAGKANTSQKSSNRNVRCVRTTD